MVVFSANIDDSVAGVESCWVAGAYECAVGVGRKLPEEPNGESFIGVEMATVSPDENRGSLLTLW